MLCSCHACRRNAIIRHTLLGLVAAADVGLLGYLFHQYDGQGWFVGRDGSSASRVRSIMMFILFTASWTTLYAFTAILFIFCDAMDSLAGMASGVVSLMITVIFWSVSTPLFHTIREGGECQGQPTISLCRQLETVEALGWVLGLLAGGALAGCSSSHRRKPRR